MAAQPAALDVITMGRCSIDLYGQQSGSRLEDIGSFAKSVGGSPSNIAIARPASASAPASSPAWATNRWGASCSSR